MLCVDDDLALLTYVATGWRWVRLYFELSLTPQRFFSPTTNIMLYIPFNILFLSPLSLSFASPRHLLHQQAVAVVATSPFRYLLSVLFSLPTQHLGFDGV